jgi:hypothetical protein
MGSMAERRRSSRIFGEDCPTELRGFGGRHALAVESLLNDHSAVVSTWDGFGLFDARSDRHNCAATGRKVPLVIKPRRAGGSSVSCRKPFSGPINLGFRPVVAEAPANRQGDGIEELSRPIFAMPRER